MKVKTQFRTDWYPVRDGEDILSGKMVAVKRSVTTEVVRRKQGFVIEERPHLLLLERRDRRGRKLWTWISEGLVKLIA